MMKQQLSIAGSPCSSVYTYSGNKRIHGCVHYTAHTYTFHFHFLRLRQSGQCAAKSLNSPSPPPPPPPPLLPTIIRSVLSLLFTPWSANAYGLQVPSRLRAIVSIRLSPCHSIVCALVCHVARIWCDVIKTKFGAL